MNDGKLINAWMSQKAGMKDIDKEAIAKKVQEMTKGSNKSIYEQELEKKRRIQIEKMKQQILQYHESPDKSIIKAEIEKRVQHIEMRRDLSRTWAHFDFDMFYIACQLLDHPEDIEKPCAVGGMGSVLCTANYVARKYGVRSALPTFIALKLCPQLVLYKPDFEKYKKYSKIMKDIMMKYDQNFESMGLDEAYVDITDYVKDKSPSEIYQFVSGIRQSIYNQTGLTVSCGVGSNRQLCKMASEQKKPNDQFILPNDREEILRYLSQQPIRKIPGIGPVTEHYLKGLGVNTIREVLERIDQLSVALTENTVESLIQSSLGIDRNYHCFKDRKSIGRSETFKPVNSPVELDNKLVDLSEQVSVDLNEQSLLACHIAVSYQTQKFQRKQKSKKLDHYTNDKNKIIKVARELLAELDVKQKIRLLGVRCTQLVDETQFKQNSLEMFLTKKKNDSKVQRLQQPSMNNESNSKSAVSKETRKMQQEPPSENNIPCPICNKIIETKGNNVILNKHIDRCLQSDGVPDEQIDKTIVATKKITLLDSKVEKEKDKKGKKGTKQSSSIFNFVTKPK